MALVGNEIIQVQGLDGTGRPSGETFPATTSQIASLASLDTSNTVATTISTVGAGTLTAAAMVGMVILRTGAQSGGFTDTTATVAQLIAVLPASAAVGTSFQLTYINNTTGGFAATISGASNVTVSGITVVQPGNFVTYLVTYASATTFTLVGVAGATATTGFNNLLVAGLVQESTTAGISAAGSTQANATALTTEINQISTCTAGQGVALPAALTGATIFVINNGANSLQVYGNNASADTIDGVVTGTGVSQMVNSMVLYTCTVGGAAGKWVSEGIATGYAGSLQTFSYADALTASATQTQGAGTLITTMMARFTTVATAGNAATLPVAAAGMQITVINAHASNSIQVFPGSGDAINALSANASVSVPAGGVCEFFTTVTGKWHTILASSTTTGSGAAVLATQPVLSGAILGGAKNCTAQVDRNNSAALTNITGLGVALLAGATYTFTAYIPGTATANCGEKFGIGTSDTLTATSMSAAVRVQNAATIVGDGIVTALNTGFGGSNSVFTYAIIAGTIVVNAAGTLTIQIAQNTSHADTCSAYVNGNMTVTRVA